MEQKIQNYYNEFKKFINCNSLPEIKPIFDIDDSQDMEGYINIKDSNNLCITIHLKPSIFNYNEGYYKCVLFHEFTHIYDSAITFKNVVDDIDLKILLSTYSEYHASQVELLCNVGYDRCYNICSKFNINKEILRKNEKINIKKYFLLSLIEAQDILNENDNIYIDLTAEEYAHVFNKSLKKIMYYLGKYNILEKYSNNPPCIFFNEFGMFEKDIEDLYKYLKTKNYNSLINSHDQFVMKYMKYYKSNVK